MDIKEKQLNKIKINLHKFKKYIKLINILDKYIEKKTMMKRPNKQYDEIKKNLKEIISLIENKI